MPTLLEKALSKGRKKYARLSESITDEDIELAIAWCQNKVTSSQVAEVKSFAERANNTVYNYLLRCLQKYIQQ